MGTFTHSEDPESCISSGPTLFLRQKRFSDKKYNIYAPAMTMTAALSVTPVRQYVLTYMYIRLYVRTYVCPTRSAL